jgi:hypothetical protein
MTTYLVIALLLVIILLLCIPFRERKNAAVSLLLLCASILIFHYYGATIVGLTALAARWCAAHWKSMLGLASVLAFFLMWLSDRKENVAIRSGDARAFNRRVEAFKSSPYNYDHEKAVAAATRIKEGR